MRLNKNYHPKHTPICHLYFLSILSTKNRQIYHSSFTFPFRIDLTSRLAILSPFLLLVRIFLEQNQYHASNIQSPYHCSMRFVRKTIEWRNDAPFSRSEKIEGRGNIPLVAPESSYVFTGA